MAEGLHYLHSYNLVHGDLKGVSDFSCHSRLFSLRQILIQRNSKANILIDKNNHARLTDFGLASIVLGNQSTVSLLDSSLRTATRWAAPEILKGGSVTKEGDVFAFAMVATEVRTTGEFGLSFLAYSPGTDVYRRFPVCWLLSRCVEWETSSTTSNIE